MGCLSKPALHLRPSILVVVTQLTTIGENDRAGKGLRAARMLRHHGSVMTREEFTIARHNVPILKAQACESARVLLKNGLPATVHPEGLVTHTMSHPIGRACTPETACCDMIKGGVNETKMSHKNQGNTF
jgi:hypothetical protein